MYKPFTKIRTENNILKIVNDQSTLTYILAPVCWAVKKVM